MIRKSLIPALALALFVPVACTGDDGTTDGGSDTDASSTSSSTSTSSTSTSGATESTGMTGSASDSNGSSTTTDSAGGSTDSSTSGTSGTTTGGTDTDTGGSPALEESCKSACEVVMGCFPDEWDSLDECVAACVDESTPLEPDAECEAAFVAFNECLAMAECADFQGEDLCLAEGEKVDAVCGGGGEECIGGAGSNPEGTECSASEECPDYKHELVCDTETCTCYDNDVMTEVCPQQMNVCMDFDPTLLDDIAADCCGW